MNILYASNNEYAPFLGISLYSLLKNNADVEYIDIYVLDNGISDKNILHLEKMTEQFHRKISFIDISNLEKRFCFQINSNGYNITTFARLFLSDLLPQNVDKVLYLDSDIIIQTSIKGLWDTDITDFLLAAIPEVYMPEKKKAYIDLAKDDIYYNAGVLLINRRNWEKESLKKSFLQYYQKMSGSLLYNDQDIINHCCKGKITSIHPKYNFEPNVYYFPYSYMKKINKYYFSGSKQEYKEMIANPAIIHFLGDERPWVIGNRNPYSHIFYSYQKESGWDDYMIIDNRQLYMLCYHILNMTTKICPWLRTCVTNLIGINKFKWFGKK